MQNRLDIKNGSILRLTKAPVSDFFLYIISILAGLQSLDFHDSVCVLQGRCADDLFKGIQSSDSDVRCESLKQLAVISTDVTFAQEFISRDGHSLLVHIVEDANECV